MRDVFMRELTGIARNNSDVILMVGDLGYSVVEQFRSEFPDRFFNVGIAEQNMMGMAAGMASEGCQVYTYSIGNFPTWRCAEQVRNDIDYHDLSVVNVVVGGGVTYGPLGYSHHAIQDYALMRSLPNMTICAPGDSLETEALCRHISTSVGPYYLRLGKGNHKLHVDRDINVGDGKICLVREGDPKNVALATGNVLYETLQDERLTHRAIYSLPMWSSRSKALVRESLIACESVITVEDHLLDCGFGSWFREAFNGIESEYPRISNWSFPLSICGSVGSRNRLHAKIFSTDHS